MAINSKKKGNKNERDLCKWFNDWTGLEFQRVPQSGGLRWSNRDNIIGDLICTDERKGRTFPFTIETKSHKDINFEHLISPVKNIRILEFWNQSKSDGEATNKIPLLFMKYNNMPKQTWFVVIDRDTFENYFDKYFDNAKHRALYYGSPTDKFVIINSSDLKEFPITKIVKKIKVARWKKQN